MYIICDQIFSTIYSQKKLLELSPINWEKHFKNLFWKQLNKGDGYLYILIYIDVRLMDSKVILACFKQTPG